MKTGKIAIFTDSDSPIQIREIEIPEPGSGQILVKIEYTTLSRSDLNTFCGKRIEKTPTILGHESVGHIVKFGPDTPEIDSRGEIIEQGDRISWAIYASKPDSEMAKKGIPQKAPELFKYGHEKITPGSTLHGGLGEYILLRENTALAKIDESVPVQVAATINCAVAIVMGAIRLAGEIPGKKILVSGAGMLGILTCALCKTLKASAIFVTDLIPARIETAYLFGADAGSIMSENLPETINKNFDNPAPFDILIELSGNPETMEKTLEFLNIGGVAVWAGAAFPSRNTQINAEKVVRNLWTIKGLHNYSEEDFICAVNFIEKYHVEFPFYQLVYDHFTLDEINDAFSYALNKNPYRVGVKIYQTVQSKTLKNRNIK